MRLVEPPALEVVAHALDDGRAERHLRPFRERSSQAAVVGERLLGDGAHDRHQRRAQLGEQRQHRGRRHALVGAVDQRVGDVRVGREKAGVLAAEVERPLQQRPHGGEVVGGARPGPGVVGGRAVRAPAGDEVGRHLDRLLEVAARDADEAGVVAVWRQAVGVGLQRVEQLAERRIGELLMCQPAQHGALPGARRCPARRHVGRLVPAQHGARRGEIADLAQPAPELFELGLRRRA